MLYFKEQTLSQNKLNLQIWMETIQKCFHMQITWLRMISKTNSFMTIYVLPKYL